MTTQHFVLQNHSIVLDPDTINKMYLDEDNDLHITYKSGHTDFLEDAKPLFDYLVKTINIPVIDLTQETDTGLVNPLPA
jgi:hypothetical protein